MILKTTSHPGLTSIPRLSWSEYFLSIAEAVSKRADCRRRAVGAVLTNSDHHIVATGYNGTRPGDAGCLSGACPRGQMSYEELKEFTDYSNCIATHAEMNAILHAGQPVQDMVMYVTDKPCPSCEKTMYNAGICEVYWPGGHIQWK